MKALICLSFSLPSSSIWVCSLASLAKKPFNLAIQTISTQFCILAEGIVCSLVSLCFELIFLLAQLRSLPPPIKFCAFQTLRVQGVFQPFLQSIQFLLKSCFDTDQGNLLSYNVTGIVKLEFRGENNYH